MILGGGVLFIPCGCGKPPVDESCKSFKIQKASILNFFYWFNKIVISAAQEKKGLSKLILHIN